jgi:hypothetical protein
MLEAILALGFFGILGAGFCVLLLLLLVAEDRPGEALAALLVTIGVMWWTGVANVPLYIWHHPGQVVMWAVGWLAVGVFWSFFKYDRFCAAHKKRGNSRPILDHQTWRITNWIVFWPFSIVAYVTGDMLKHLVEWIITRFNKVYETIASRHFPA